jgi:acyl-[acyl-carrier-protein]-phospholipid O-acyltransferase/long-chain-fatty-acid--[acyl-carrier-protein] ligase
MRTLRQRLSCTYLTAFLEHILFTAIIRAIFKLLFRVKITGAFNPNPSKRTVFVANHTSLLDGVLLALFLPQKPTFLVHTTVLENPLFRFLLKGVDHFATDPTNPLALKAIIRLLEEDKSVVIFPEGRITVTGGLMKIYDGAAFVSARTGADVVAVHMDGPAVTWFSYLAGRFPRRLFPKITLHFLPARKIAMPDKGSAKERRRAVGEEMRRILQHAVFAARKERTLFEGFLDAVDMHGRRKKMAEDLQFVPGRAENGKPTERKAVVTQTYGQILRSVLAVQRIASKISKPGDRVGVLLPNSTGTAAVVLGLSSGGRIPAMLNFTAGSEGMQNALIASDTRIILTSRRFIELGKLQPVVERLTGVTIHYMEDLKGLFTLADKLWLVGYAMFRPRATAQPTQIPADAAVMLFTSGSEGKPKGVVHTHNSLLANIAQVNAVADFGPADKFMVCLPMFHSFGLTAGTLLPLLSGCPVFFYPTPLHYRIIPEVVYDRRATVLFGTSTFLAGYAKFAHPFDFQTLRYVVAGAEKLSDTVRNTWFEKFGIRILSGYGITETAPVLSVNTPMAYKSDTVGSLLPGIEYKLEPVPGIENGGLLHVKGPNLMAGYMLHAKPGVISPFESSAGEGWYNTGDIVSVDAEGFVTIRGRAKRFAKLAGEMVSLEVVESIASAASPKFSHAAVARPDSAKGESVILFTTDKDLLQEHLASKAKELGLPGIAVSRRIAQVDAIPLLGTGKTDYVTLNAMAQAL